MTDPASKNSIIDADTVIPDVVARWPAAQEVLQRYDGKAGVCICCVCLFDKIEDIVSRFSLNLEIIWQELREAAAGTKPAA